jgi:hypothetical protein
VPIPRHDAIPLICVLIWVAAREFLMIHFLRFVLKE